MKNPVMGGPLRVTTVCTHNRTRSVLMAGLFGHHAAAAGLDVEVTSTGFVAAGLPPTDRTVRLLRRAGIDVSKHRSSRIGHGHVPNADLILTAERDHVVSIASLAPALFDIAFTLPEAVERGRRIGPRADRDLTEWITALDEGRVRQFSYLDDDGPGEVADPTGRSPAEWRSAYASIDSLTKELVTLIA